MGACFLKYPTCGEVNPSTRFFNVCCYGRIIIQNSEIDGMDKMKHARWGKKQIQQEMKEILHPLFYDVSKPSAYTSRRNVYRAARCLLLSILQVDVDQWFEAQLSYTLHIPTHIHFPHNKTIVKSIDDQWQADMYNMQSKAKHHNDGKHSF